MLAFDHTFESVRVGKAICYRIRGDRRDGALETENTAR